VAGPRTRRRRLSLLSLPHPATLLLLALIALISALPALRLLAEAFSPDALARVLADPRTWRALRRTVEVMAGSTAGAVLIGGAAALSLGLIRVPGGPVLAFLFVLVMLVPPQIAALAWLSALGPSSPLLLTLGMEPGLGAPHPLHGPWGIIALLSVQQAPLVFLSVRAALRQVSAEQIEAARCFGASPTGLVLRVVLPLITPALAGGGALAALAAMGNFGTTAMLGLPARYTVLSVLVFSRLSALGPGGLAEAAGLSLILAVMAGLVLTVQRQIAARRPVATLGGFRPLAPQAAGRVGMLIAACFAFYLGIVLVLPLAALVVAAATPAAGVALTAATATTANLRAVLAPGANTATAFANSLLLAGGAALVLALVAVPSAALARVRAVGLAIDLPYALPGVCVGVAMILVYLRPLPVLEISLYGTLALIGIAYLARFFALALKPVSAARAAIDARLGEAAAILGARYFHRLRTIELPLLGPAAVAGFLLVALTALNEITVSILLYAAGSQTLGVVIFGLNDSGQTGMAAATALLALAMVGLLLAAATLAARRLPRGALPWQG
jgi:iron(III) transport system permease protein